MACSADRTVSQLASSPHSTRQAYPFLRTFLSSASTITRLRRAASPLTTVRQPLREEGHMAANIALDMIKGAEPTTSVMHMQLIQRDSL